MDKLLPCPFCGGEAIHDTITMVCCKICFATAPASKWNTRHTPEGWQLVPVELTPEMLDAASSVKTIQSESGWQLRPTAQDSYTAMLAAAPKWGGE